jgi:ABC-2 type transport system ATP-binding protein
MSVLAIDRLSKRYRSGTLANDRISLHIEPGEIYGLLGPNGAGKTTLVRQVLGQLRPSEGTIHVAGVDVVADPGYARRAIGFLPQGAFDLQSLHVDELIVYAGRLRGLSHAQADRRGEELIARLGLQEFRHTRMHAASGGVRRLAGFGAAIVAAVPLLVLDEPTNDVDPIRRQVLWEMIAELGARGTAVLLVTHNLAEAERVIDRLAIIAGGRILREGTPASLRSLVSERLRLEVTTSGEFCPQPALIEEKPGGPYLFDRADLLRVSAWLDELREAGRLLDFRISPPSLDDIYAATLGSLTQEVAS